MQANVRYLSNVTLTLYFKKKNCRVNTFHCLLLYLRSPNRLKESVYVGGILCNFLKNVASRCFSRVCLIIIWLPFDSIPVWLCIPLVNLSSCLHVCLSVHLTSVCVILWEQVTCLVLNLHHGQCAILGLVATAAVSEPTCCTWVRLPVRVCCDYWRPCTSFVPSCGPSNLINSLNGSLCSHFLSSLFLWPACFLILLSRPHLPRFAAPVDTELFTLTQLTDKTKTNYEPSWSWLTQLCHRLSRFTTSFTRSKINCFLYYF